MGAWKNSAVATCAHVNSIYVWVKWIKENLKRKKSLVGQIEDTPEEERRRTHNTLNSGKTLTQLHLLLWCNNLAIFNFRLARQLHHIPITLSTHPDVSSDLDRTFSLKCRRMSHRGFQASRECAEHGHEWASLKWANVTKKHTTENLRNSPRASARSPLTRLRVSSL